VHALLSPSPLGLAIAILLAIAIPLFLHSVVFRASGLTTLPSILLIGPSGSGKTSLLTLFERGANATTHTSQTPISVECSLPLGTLAGSDRYRSVNDPTNQQHKKFLLIDTPGHGKLRHLALDNITNPQNLKGIIFLVDAAAGDGGLRQTADYLHDVLLLLQKRTPVAKKVLKEVSVLIAANKMDLFTALPARDVKNRLQAEITKIRTSRSRSLPDSGIGKVDGADNENDDWLGEVGSEEFEFSQLQEFDVTIKVSGGNVVGESGPAVQEWWEWVSERL